MATQLFATVRAKAPLPNAQRKALLSHWSPRVAKAIARSLYPDFRGTYEQHLWLLTHKAAEGTSTYAREAREKGILFLQPYRMEDTRLCGTSHYLYYVLKWQTQQVNELLAVSTRCSERVNKKHLAEALRLYAVYTALPVPRSQRFDDPEPAASSVNAAASVKARQERKQALNATVKVQMMLTTKNMNRFKVIAYGWKHLEAHA
jgi:hypothetical protein